MKNLSNVLIAVLSSTVVLSAQEYKEITSVQYSMEETEYVLSHNNRYRLYTPARFKTIKTLDKRSVTHGDYGNFISTAQRGAVSPISIKEHDVKLSGAYIVLLEPFQIPFSMQQIGANILYDQLDNTSPFIKIMSHDDYRRIAHLTQSEQGIDYNGYTLFVRAQTLPYRYSSIPAMNESDYSAAYHATYRSGYDLLTLWESFLKSVNVTYYGKPFFVRMENGDVYPAIIKVFGNEQLMYAMYGVWTDEERANLYGYHKGDRIYMSAAEMLPAHNDTSIAVKEFNLNRSLRYGRQTFSYVEVVNNPKKIYPLLAWSPEPVHSEITGKQYDQTGRAFKHGIEVPNSPDTDNNDNGLGLQQCPDQDWYFDLFCECAGNIVSHNEIKYTADGFTDYKDFAYMNMMSESYDPTIYGEDNSVTSLVAEPDVQPADPLLFNKEGKLLSGTIPQIYDPFAADAQFNLYKRYWKWTIGKTGYHKKTVSVTPKMKTNLAELHQVYDYFIAGKQTTPNWDYQKKGTTWTKKWPYGGDIEIHIDKEEYADSAWIIANPFANYEPFEDFQTFAVYDNNTAANRGPFRTITRESDTRVSNKNNKPEYRRYSDPWIGGDIPSEQAWEKKDWYVQWQYYLIFQDKWGRKTCVGTLTFTSTLWINEDNDIMPSNFNFNGSHYNRTVNVGGSQLFNTQASEYDTNSKEYRTDQTDIHDRAPDEFDKGEAMREIARKILVAEVFDYSMKTLHYIGTRQNNQVGLAAAALYESSKRIENRIAQSHSYKLAKQTYEGYLFWRRSMDVIKNLRDTYIRIGDAWDGLLYTVSAVKDYYKELDLRNVRLTNITDLFPRSAFMELDYRVFAMQKSFADFNAAVHALALETDSLTGGNYGPLNPTIRVAYAALQSSMLQTGQNTTMLLDNTNKEVQELKSKSKGTASDQQYLSNITRSTSNIIANQRLKVMNNGTRNVALALYLTQSDAKQWLSYSRYMQQIGKNVPKRFATASKNVDSDSWAALAWSMQQPRILDDQTNQFLMHISEEDTSEH